MLPERIRSFVGSLITRTEGGSFVWVYDDMNASVQLGADEFNVTVRYSLSEAEDVGEFVVTYLDRAGKEYRFYTNQAYPDYDVVRRLYETAQSSGMALPF